MNAFVQAGLIGAGVVYLLVIGSILVWRYRLNSRARTLNGRWSGRGFDGRTICQRMDGHAGRPLVTEAPPRDRSKLMEGARGKIARMPFFRRRDEPPGILLDELP